MEADPNHANNLWSYGDFLEQQRKDYNAAESYYKRAIDANPKSAKFLCHYAVFLNKKRNDMDLAELYYKRAIEAAPKNSDYLCNYAIFLQRDRRALDGAQSYYKQALELDPNEASAHCNYGQILAGNGLMQEAAANLLQAFKQFVKDKDGALAETCFSLWLISSVQGKDAKPWECYFKFLIQINSNVIRGTSTRCLNRRR